MTVIIFPGIAQLLLTCSSLIHKSTACVGNTSEQSAEDWRRSWI